jgi:putative endonuclease
MFVYIIHSPALDRYYIGETSDVQQRLLQHRSAFFKASFTTRASDWELVLSIPCADRSVARKLEAFLKRQRNRDFFRQFINDDPYRNKLLLERFGISR